MDIGTISSRYAKALFSLAKEKGLETRVYDDMKILADHGLPHNQKGILQPDAVQQHCRCQPAGYSKKKRPFHPKDCDDDQKNKTELQYQNVHFKSPIPIIYLPPHKGVARLSHTHF